MKEGKFKNWEGIGIHKSYYSNGSLMIESDIENDSMIIFDKSGKSIYNGNSDVKKHLSFFYENVYK